MMSSQEDPVSQKLISQLSAAMASQQRTFAGTVPNMVPRPAATSKKHSRNPVPSFPNLEVNHQASYPDTSSLVSRPPSSAYTGASHINISPRRSGVALSPVVHSNTSESSSGMTAANLASYKSNSQAANLPIPSRQKQGVLSVEQTEQATHIPSKPADNTVSRLPSKDVPRKAPLQGKSYAGKSLSQYVSRKFPRPKEQRSTSQQETPTAATASTQKHHQSPNDERQATAIQSPVVLPETNVAKKRPRNNREEKSQEIEIVEVKKVKHDERENGNNTETTSNDKACSQREKACVTRPRRRPTKKRATEAAFPTPPGYLQGQRPLYKYQVPLEIEGIRQALGQSNWNQYLYLLESLWLEKVTAHEFEQGTKPLFHIEYAGIRKKMNSMVVTKMIMPRLEELRSNLHRRP